MTREEQTTDNLVYGLITAALLNAAGDGTLTEAEAEGAQDGLKALRAERDRLRMELFGVTADRDFLRAYQQRLDAAPEEAMKVEWHPGGEMTIDDREVRGLVSDLRKALAEARKDAEYVAQEAAETDAELHRARLRLAEQEQIIDSLRTFIDRGHQ